MFKRFTKGVGVVVSGPVKTVVGVVTLNPKKVGDGIEDTVGGALQAGTLGVVDALSDSDEEHKSSTKKMQQQLRSKEHENQALRAKIARMKARKAQREQERQKHLAQQQKEEQRQLEAEERALRKELQKLERQGEDSDYEEDCSTASRSAPPGGI